jgi:hypothetical protein
VANGSYLKVLEKVSETVKCGVFVCDACVLVSCWENFFFWRPLSEPTASWVLGQGCRFGSRQNLQNLQKT